MAREVIVYCDIDGTQNFAPPPVKTGMSLVLNGKLTLPSSDKTLRPAKRCNAFTYWFHKIRPFTSNSEQGIQLLAEVSSEVQGRLKLGILSGRDPGLHDITIEKLLDSGRLKYFDPLHIKLCGVNSSSGFKEQTGRKAVENGATVILIDDDLKAGLMFVRANELCCDGRLAYAYILSNVTNGPWMRRHLSLPDNVTLVPSFLHAARDISQKIKSGEI